jgi:hypothetical protein
MDGLRRHASAGRGLVFGVGKRVEYAASEGAFEVAVDVEPELLEPGPPRLLGGTCEQLAEA